MVSAILAVLKSGDIESLRGRLSDDVVFSSPAADYHGPAAVSHMLGLISTVLDEVDPSREWIDERDSVSAFTARVSGSHVEGLLREQRGPAGTLTHVTLFLRPYAVLRTAIARMRELMADAPPPRPSA
jgi:hypothetical protein